MFAFMLPISGCRQIKVELKNYPNLKFLAESSILLSAHGAQIPPPPYFCLFLFLCSFKVRLGLPRRVRIRPRSCQKKVRLKIIMMSFQDTLKSLVFLPRRAKKGALRVEDPCGIPCRVRTEVWLESRRSRIRKKTKTTPHPLFSKKSKINTLGARNREKKILKIRIKVKGDYARTRA